MKKLKFLSLALVLMLGVTVLTGSSCLNQEQNKEQNQNQEPVQAEDIKETKQVAVVVNYGDEEKKYKVDWQEGMTAFGALKAAIEKENLEVKTTSYDFGLSIDAIGDKVGGQNKMYWMYYIDGSAAPASVDKQEVKEGMKVEFKYEKSSM
jgi:hypothetical protein